VLFIRCNEADEDHLGALHCNFGDVHRSVPIGHSPSRLCGSSTHPTPTTQLLNGGAESGELSDNTTTARLSGHCHPCTHIPTSSRSLFVHSSTRLPPLSTHPSVSLQQKPFEITDYKERSRMLNWGRGGGREGV
jgi:hypothetical protein